jgi:hypothetical protein
LLYSRNDLKFNNLKKEAVNFDCLFF